ncbi:MAG TPA: ATP-binding protein [Burkholderiaceae bacterium]
MNRVSDALAVRSWRWAPALAALALLFGLLFASSTWVTPDAARPADAAPSIAPLALLFTALALVIAVLALALGGALERSRLTPALRRARDERQALAALLDAWQWQTDAAHRLTRLVPPHGVPGTAWADSGPAGQLLWERFECADGALRARLDAHAPLRELGAVRHGPGDAAPQSWRLDAEPLFDAQGRFAGYLGTARATAAAPNTVAAPAEAARGDAGDPEAFSYTVSHDLRAPIRVVEGFTRIVKEDYGRVLDRIGLDHLDRVLGAAARMNHMIDALLTLSQLSTQPLVRQPVNLSQLAGFVVDDLRRGAPERVVEVRIEPDLIAQGDPTLLRIVLENLLGNAWKYSARADAARISFEVGGLSGKPSFTVRDNGAGFDMRYAERLFGVFQRLHSASEFQGTGVGLASVRRIVRRHGGEIWAEAEVGRGAAFHFTLGG